MDWPRGPIVGTDWLAQHLDHPEVRIVDGSWFLPTAGRDPHGEYGQARIPGAVFFDLDEHADHETDLPHMLPTPAAFATAVGRMGIAHDHAIVVYDSEGLFSGPRVWWTFKVMGAERVAVLDGGLKRWREEGRPVTGDTTTHPPATFEPAFRADRVIAFDEVRAASAGAASQQIVDARSAGRFRGEAPEPRPGLSSGSMPGSLNLPYDRLITDGSLRTPDDLRAAFTEAGVDLDRAIITTCGTGVTAAILSLALDRLGAPPPRLYDGSWTEWAGRDDTEIVVATSP